MATPNSRRNVSTDGLDLYTTPYAAVDALLKVESFDGNILEPCAGHGHISKVLKSRLNNKIIVNDIEDYNKIELDSNINFFNYNLNVDNIITNPPYNLAAAFAQNAFLITKRKITFFVRINFLESKKRKILFQNKNKPVRIHAFSERVNCPKDGIGPEKGGAVFYCWVVWDNSVNNKETNFNWI